MKNVTLNNDQRLFIIPCNGGYSCLGFDVCRSRCERLAAELAQRGHNVGVIPPDGTLAQHQHLCDLGDIADDDFRRTGVRCECGLNPRLRGSEGRRVEVTEHNGTVRRFQVGRSTGWIPCHLELYNRRSRGGVAISPDDFKNVRIIR